LTKAENNEKIINLPFVKNAMSIAPSFVTPLRYPGGKARLGHWLSELLKFNKLENSTYIEPYAGGAGAAVYLLTNKLVKSIAINDIDPAVYSFWWALLNETDALKEKILHTEVSIETWDIQKRIISNQDNPCRVELGFAAFFLNRTNRSGIINGGVIGGKSQTGKYKIDARYNKIGLLSRIDKIASLREHIHLTNLDALELLHNWRDRKDTIVYLDPPYYQKGGQLYRNHYQPEDHAMIAEKVCSLQAPWLVTYDNCSEIREIYKNSNHVEFSFHYSTHLQRPIGQEVMFYNNIHLHSTPKMRR